MNELHCRRAPWSDSIEVCLINRGRDRSYVAMAPNMREIVLGEMIAPMLQLEHTEAQRLMDELWNCGLRPSEGTGSAGSLAATERHLKDMQTIAMGLLRKDGVNL